MADPCGVIGVIGVAAQIAKILANLSLDWHDAPADVEDFLSELQTLKLALSESNTNIILNEEFTNAFEGRHSAVLSQFGKDAPPDATLLVDACRRELDDLLADLDKRSRGHRVGWERIKSVFLAKRTRETVEKLQRQCQMLNGQVAIDSAALSAATFVQVKEARREQRDRDAAALRDKVLDWLTPHDYATQQNDYAVRRKARTGEWFLDSKEYCAWRDGHDEARALFCPGIPGAGKTIIASMVIGDLLTRFSDDGAVCVAYVYLNFRRHADQKAGDLLLSLLKQLAQGQPTLASSVEGLHEKHTKYRTRPSFAEVCTALGSVAGLYKRVFVVVDALDESAIEERDTFLDAIAGVQRESRVSVLATSRPDILSHFSEHFETHNAKEIRAVDGDILDYVNGRLESFPRRRLAKHPDIQDRIRRKLIEAADGMFLLAKLQIDYLLSKPTAGDIEDALKDLPSGLSGLDTLYGHAMNRINAQTDGAKELTTNVLRWIVHARRPLKTIELRHAVAIRLGARGIGPKYLPGVEDMVSDSAGLVTNDKASGIISLVHFTTQDYFERSRARWFPDAEKCMAEACVTYLSFDAFCGGPPPIIYYVDFSFEFPAEFPLYEYAARNWGHHARKSDTAAPIPSVVSFLQDPPKVHASVQVLMQSFLPSRCQWEGLHLAAYFGEEHSLHFLLSHGAFPDPVNSRLRTPLLLAVENGHSRVVESLLAHGADLEHGVDGHGTPLFWAASFGLEDFIELLLSHGADIEATDYRGLSPLAIAASKGHEGPMALLMARGADPGRRAAGGSTPLSFAASRGKVKVVRMLLSDDRAEVDATDQKNRTLLSEASKIGRSSVVNVLLTEGAADPNIADVNGNHRVDVNLRDNKGSTPLMMATINSKQAMVQLLLERDDIDPNIEDEDGHTPLLRAARLGPDSIAELLVKSDKTDINKRDSRGHTPLAWAAWAGREDVTALLLTRSDVNLDCTTDTGETPLNLAAKNRRKEVVTMLLLAHERAGLPVAGRFEQLLQDWDAGAEEGELSEPRLLRDEDVVY